MSPGLGPAGDTDKMPPGLGPDSFQKSYVGELSFCVGYSVALAQGSGIFRPHLTTTGTFCMDIIGDSAAAKVTTSE